MITGNEPINPIVGSDGTMYSKSNEIDKQNVEFDTHYFGMTIRQQFAMAADVDINDYAVAAGEKILGREINNSDAVENIKWWIDFEAAIKVMRADALIEALNK